MTEAAPAAPSSSPTAHRRRPSTGGTAPASRPDPVNWDLAAAVATRVAGREPLAGSYHYDSLAPDFAELTVRAEALVEAETGLRSLAGPARARVVDRPAWIRANLASFQRLLRPLTDRLAERLPARSLVNPVTRNLAGAEVGTLLGWMSTRVLGQYDLLVIEDEDPDDQDLVYFVGPNVLALEKRYGFAPREFRLWLALHEVTHRMQFTGVPWMRAHFLGLVDDSLGSIDADPRRLLHALRRAVEMAQDGRGPLDDGLLALFATPAQHDTFERIGGLMSLLEGHGDVTMDRAGAADIPGAERFSRLLRHRRRSGGTGARFLQKLVGIEAKLNQYEQGEAFLAHVEQRAGAGVIGRIWEEPSHLPTLREIREPDAWLRRTGLLAGG